MNTNKRSNINIATIIVLALLAISTSPEAITQIIAFVSLLVIVLGRDFLLRRLAVLKS